MSAIAKNAHPSVSYPELFSKWNLAKTEAGIKQVVDYLVSIWLNDYYSRLTDRIPTKVVQTSDSGFFYLFDIEQERLIAACGISRGKSSQARDKSRMQGHPLSNGSLYHRGHAIPHQMEGPTDINLSPQLGQINQGPFKVRENKATNNPGSLYFTYWVYEASDDNTSAVKSREELLKYQTAVFVQQAVLLPGHPADSFWFHNS